VAVHLNNHYKETISSEAVWLDYHVPLGKEINTFKNQSSVLSGIKRGVVEICHII